MSSDLLLKNIKKVYGITGSGEKQPFSIWIQDGFIEAIGSVDAVRGKGNNQRLESAKVLDCSDMIVLPGFVDAHTHLLFAGTREKEFYWRAEGVSYMRIIEEGGGIYKTVKAVEEASEEVLIKNGIRFLDKALQFGTTTIEIKSGYGLGYESEKKMLRVLHRLNQIHPVDIVPTFLVHMVPKGCDRKVYIQKVAEAMIPDFRQFADWFDLFLEKGIFSFKEAEFLIEKAIEAGYHVGFHTNQMHNLGGIKLAVRWGARRVDHLEVLEEEDIALIQKEEGLYLIFLPAAEAYLFSQNRGKIHPFLNHPSRIVLATDFNPGSSPVLSPQVVMALAVLRYRISDPFLLLHAFTRNPAQMLYLDDRGQIRKGAKGDLICMELDHFEQIPYFGTLNLIKYVVKEGEIVVGGK